MRISESLKNHSSYSFIQIQSNLTTIIPYAPHFPEINNPPILPNHMDFPSTTVSMRCDTYVGSMSPRKYVVITFNYERSVERVRKCFLTKPIFLQPRSNLMKLAVPDVP